MIELLMNHVWQSTWFALAAALLVLFFRHNSAAIRFNIWLAASLKFLIPLPVFVLVGRSWQPISPAPPASAPIPLSTLDQFAEPASTPFSTVPQHSAAWFWILAFAVWAVGFLLLLTRRTLQLRRLNSIAWSATPLTSAAPLPIRETPANLEPGLFGILRPVLLLPKGIAARLAPAQLDTIVAHEVEHWRRRDNLTAALHMVVEALFWFHPLVWRLGHRMMVERERAVDEAVIQAGSDRETYAAAALGVAGPIAIGLLSAPYVLAQEASEMKHYQSAEWGFAVDIPKRWNAFPPVSSNSPTEVMRFISYDNGANALIVFRNPNSPNGTPTAILSGVQAALTKKGFAHFATGETTIGGRKVMTIDADRPLQQGTGT
jgi:beta-lactamase regulating signal transducer with metallopeptidase domain